MAELRTPEALAIYKEYTAKNPDTESCVLCGKPAIKEFKYWKIVVNSFPYDIIATSHDMIMPLRHVTELELNEDELKELHEIKFSEIENKYDFIIENTFRNKSIPSHFHLHLIVGKN